MFHHRDLLFNINPTREREKEMEKWIVILMGVQIGKRDES